ncbi:MAG: hypothetical protein WCK37_05095 [Candidatus Falkowbacteria bacterium]
MRNSESFQISEKVVKTFSLISIVSIIIAICSGLYYLLVAKIAILDTVACYGFTLFVVPFLIFLPVMVANYSKGLSIDNSEFTKPIMWFFFIIINPFIIMWFLSGLNALYHFVPDYHVADRILAEVLRNNFQQKMFSTFIMIYGSLISVGLILRMFKINSRTVLAQ